MKNIYDPGYYRILCVGNNATKEQIKTAWRGQMKHFHEDVSNSVDAKEKSQELNEAYSVLSDTGKRATYDVALATYINAKKSQDQKATSSDNSSRYKDAAQPKYEWTPPKRQDSSGAALFALFILFLIFAGRK
jgi:DnaJ-class molecular chaperone